MEMAYAAADVVISRSGAMSVAELCVVKKPVIFVPFPFAAEDHQTVNAKQLVKQNAALMVKMKLVQQQLVQKAIELIKNENLQNELKNNISKFSITNADKQIAINNFRKYISMNIVSNFKFPSSIEKTKAVYFIGIGGIGMSAIARYFNHLGIEVSGYDKTPTTLTNQLEQEGITIHFSDDVNLIPKQVDFVIYTPAIPTDHTD